MYYLSKGYVKTNLSDNIIEVAHCGRLTELYGERRWAWLAGVGGFQKIEMENREIIQELLAEGLVAVTEDDSDEAKYHTIANVLFLPCRAKKKTYLLFGEENVIYKWLRFSGMILTTPELIFLIENKIEPTSELLFERNIPKLISRIYLEGADLDSNLEYQMQNVDSCRRVCDDLLRMFRKHRVYIE